MYPRTSGTVQGSFHASDDGKFVVSGDWGYLWKIRGVGARDILPRKRASAGTDRKIGGE